jgi:hypothetical protein
MHLRLVVSTLFLIAGSVTNAQQKINCESCQSSILIVVDQQCRLRVDAQPLGSVAASQSKVVRVDTGEHLIEAQAGDLKWEKIVQVEKPGQIIVRTNLLSAKAADEWVGEWVGEADYGEVRYPNGMLFAYHRFERLTFRVSKEGACTVARETSLGNGFAKDGESEFELVQRVTASARTGTYAINNHNCTITPQGEIQVGDISVNADRNLTFNKIRDEPPFDGGRVTVRLEARK